MARKSNKSAPDQPAAVAEANIQEIIHRQHFPPGVSKNFATEFGGDHTGCPSVIISFTVEKSRDPTKAYVTRLNEFAKAVSSAILDADSSRWPYIKFVTQS
jgi:hypothetical protein